MIVLLILLIVIILLFALIYYITYNNLNENNELNNDEFNEEELEQIGEDELIEEFDETNDIKQNNEIEYEISKEDYEKIRNDNFNNQFFNFFNRLNNSSDNVDNSVEKLNRMRNSKFGFTEESSIGMKIKDVADYLMKK